MKKSRQKKHNKYVHRNGVFVSNAMHFFVKWFEWNNFVRTFRGLGGFSPYEQFLQISIYGKSLKKLSMDVHRQCLLFAVWCYKANNITWCFSPLIWVSHIHKAGEGGGIFIIDSYKPYNNTLTPLEQERLKKMYDAAEGEDKKILERVLRKYGAYKLEL